MTAIERLDEAIAAQRETITELRERLHNERQWLAATETKLANEEAHLESDLLIREELLRAADRIAVPA